MASCLKLFLVLLFTSFGNYFLFAQESYKLQAERLKTLLIQNDIAKVKSFESNYLKSLFEEDTISAVDLSIQFLKENKISDTISMHLYTFVLLQSSLEKINFDLESINQIDKKIESQKDLLSKALIKVHEKAPLIDKKSKKKGKSDTQLFNPIVCPKDKIQTALHTKLRYFDADNCSSEIPNEFSEAEKNNILAKLEEAFKDKGRTLDINLKAQHQLVDIKSEIKAYLDYWTSVLEKKSDESIRFDPLGR